MLVHWVEIRRGIERTSLNRILIEGVELPLYIYRNVEKVVYGSFQHIESGRRKYPLDRSDNSCLQVLNGYSLYLFLAYTNSAGR